MSALDDQTKDHYAKVFGHAPTTHRYPLQKQFVDVLAFPDVPCGGAQTFATSGLGARLAQELIFACYRAQSSRATPVLLGAIAKQLLDSGDEPLRRGQLLGPAGPIDANTSMVGFYVCAPAYFAGLDPLSATPSSVRFLWLVPVYESESRWIAAHDDDTLKFESELERVDVDLLDLTRPELALRS